jgi:hypothetical protein
VLYRGQIAFTPDYVLLIEPSLEEIEQVNKHLMTAEHYVNSELLSANEFVSACARLKQKYPTYKIYF